MATEPPRPNIDIGRVLSRAFEATKANALAFFGLSLLLIGIPSFFTQYLMITRIEPLNGRLAASHRAADFPDLQYLFSPAFWAPFAGVMLAALVGYLILQIMVTRSTILQLGRRQPDISGSFSLALWLALPAFLLTLCVVVLMILGFILLIFPALMVWCALCVALPVLVQERAGIFGSMARSRALTSGSRWRIFLLVILIWVVSMMVSGIAGAIGGISTTYDGMMAVQNPIVSGIANGIGATFTGLVTIVILAALYVELREVKEGAATTELATVFD